MGSWDLGRLGLGRLWRDLGRFKRSLDGWVKVIYMDGRMLML